MGGRAVRKDCWDLVDLSFKSMSIVDPIIIEPIWDLKIDDGALRWRDNTPYSKVINLL